MKSERKIMKSLSLGLILGLSCVGAAELPLSWERDSGITAQDGLIKAAKGKKILLKSQKFKVDPQATYTVQLESRAVNADQQATSYVLAGFQVFNAQGKEITSSAIMAIADTFTTVAAEAKKGDTIIKVKDAAKWQPIRWYGTVIKAKKDMSDLPNFNNIGNAVTKISRKAGYWELTMQRPLTCNIAAGTGIRQHRGGSYLYTGGAKLVGPEWTKFQGSIQGHSQANVWQNDKWPQTTIYASFIILTNWNAKPTATEYRNVKLIKK